MGRNIGFATFNILIIAVFFGLIWGFEGYAYAVGIHIILIGLLCWNPVGDWIVATIILQGKHIPSGADMEIVIGQYLRDLVSLGVLEYKPYRHLMYTKSKLSYFLPVSTRFFVVSFSLQTPLIQNGAQLLHSRIDNGTYDRKLMCSRRVLLLTAFGYMIAMRILEVWAIIFATGVKLLVTLCVLLASGALFGSGSDIAGWSSIGYAIGTIIVKINDIVNSIQDKVVEWLIKVAVSASIGSIFPDVSV